MARMNEQQLVAATSALIEAGHGTFGFQDTISECVSVLRKIPSCEDRAEVTSRAQIKDGAGGMYTLYADALKNAANPNYFVKGE